MSKQFCEDHNIEIQPIERLTECSTMNGEIFGYEGFVELNVQIPGRDISEDHLFLVTSEKVIKRRYQLYWGLTS